MDNVTLLKNLYAAFGSGDIPTVLGSDEPGHQVARGGEQSL